MRPVPENTSVLTIDDNEDVRKSIVSYLEDAGFLVHEATGGRHGIEMFEKHHPDLVFTDLMMPEFDGLAVVKEIARLSPDTPVVVISGNSSVNHAMEAVRQGAWEYITKPILDLSIIDRIAAQVLDRAHTIRLDRIRQNGIREAGPCLDTRGAEPPEGKSDSTQIELVAGGIAHDFKNILTGIVGNLSLAQIHLDQSHKSAVSIRNAELASQRANELAQKLMDLSKPSASRSKGVRVAEAIKECLDLSMAGHGIARSLKVAEDIRDACMDEGEFCQVINNLILNALQAMPADGTLSILADNVHLEPGNALALAAGNHVRVRIVDTGCGIPATALGKVFAPYFTTKQSGNGLGLASAKSIMERSRGRIELDSTVGVGTTVTLVIPAC